MKIVRSYIGAKSSSICFNDVPIKTQEVEFHFIVAFARDYDRHSHRLNGLFQPYWNRAHFNYRTINEIKESYPNVRVFFSIGSIDDMYPFNPEHKDSWVPNAFYSIENIINENNLDGIDISYRKIMSTPDVFVECIGELIKRLKEAHIIEFASIAPTPGTNKYYHALYNNNRYKKYIDLVNYQFYTENVLLENVAIFKRLVNKKINEEYSEGNFLVGFSTDKRHARKLPERVFFKGWEQMEEQLKGVVIWCADDSWPGFKYEQMAQLLVVKSRERQSHGLTRSHPKSVSSVTLARKRNTLDDPTSSFDQSIQDQLDSLLESYLEDA